MLFSSTFPSFLLPALSYAFVSQSNNLVASTALRSMAPPPEVQLTKHYYIPHVEEIKRQLVHVKDLGSASAEEWIKGLDSEGKDRSIDAARWEQWEAKGGLKKVNARPNGRSAGTFIKQLPQVGIDKVKAADSSSAQASHGITSPSTRTGHEFTSCGGSSLVQNVSGRLNPLGDLSARSTNNRYSYHTNASNGPYASLRWSTSAAPHYFPASTSGAKPSGRE